MAFKESFDKKKDKDPIDTPQDAPISATSESIQPDAGTVTPVEDGTLVTDAPTSTLADDAAIERDEVTSEGGAPADALGVSEDAPVSSDEEAPVAPIPDEPSGEPDEPDDSDDSEEEIVEDADAGDASAEEPVVPTEEIVPETASDSSAPTEAAEVTPVGAAEEAPAEEDGGFVMDDETFRAFIEEGEMDDYIYAGATYEEREETLSRIADNAETLAEEGTALVEQREREEREKPKDEPRFNENGEPIDENGKVILKRSLENKLILADTRERRYYNKIKNEILSYAGIKAEMQTMSEVFRRGKQVVARLTLAGFTRIYFALNPEEFDVDRYKQADQTTADFDDTRMLLRVRDDDEFAIVSELLAIMMGALGIDKAETPSEEDFLPSFPRRSDAVLEKKGKMLSYEEKDEKLLQKERRAEERRAAGISEDVDEPQVEVENQAEPLVVLPLTLENKLHQSTNTIKLL